jgi:hypothetical protein
MRNIFLFSLPLTIVVAAGCGPQPDEQAARSDLKRDLTLVSRPPDRAVIATDRVVASSLELGEVRTQPARSVSRDKLVRHRSGVRRPARRPASRAAEPDRPAPIVRATIADVAAPNPGAQPVAAVPAGSRELPPGKTVSVIPVSSGPSPSGERGAEDVPWAGTGGSGMGGGIGIGGGGSGMGGGGCRGRGTGIPEFGGQPRPRGILY